MNIREFHQLPQFKDMLDAKNLEVGTKFLTGARVLNQVDNKNINEIVTYYIVTKVQNNGNVSYTQKMERLTGIREEDRNDSDSSIRNKL